MYYLILTAVGIASMLVLLYKKPYLSAQKTIKKHSVSVIIPVRNEANNIAQLLQCLEKQSYEICEIICVNDESSDTTCEEISKFKRVKLLHSDSRCCVNGKAVACQKAAAVAKGELLLFLDADVRMSKNALEKLVGQYELEQKTISVQPYHSVGKWYENGSFFFNLVQLGANGSCCTINTESAGLFGPVILMEKKVYEAIGGHRCAVDSIVDDLELGRQLSRLGYKYSIKMGCDSISFRMYPDGISAMFQGWLKNIASGAGYTSPVLFILTFLWFTGLTSSLILLTQTILSPQISTLTMALLSYLLWVFVLKLASKNVGKFGWPTIFCYPLLLLFFLVVFIVSSIKKLLNISVVWRGRKIKLRSKQ